MPPSRATAQQLLDIIIERDAQIHQLKNQIHQLQFAEDVAVHRHQQQINTLNAKILESEDRDKRVRRRLAYVHRNLRRALQAG